jgi:hypothetical protein
MIMNTQDEWIQHLYEVVEQLCAKNSIKCLAQKEQLFFKLSNTHHYPSPEEFKLMDNASRRNHVIWWETEGRNDPDFQFLR